MRASAICSSLRLTVSAAGSYRSLEGGGFYKRPATTGERVLIDEIRADKAAEGQGDVAAIAGLPLG
jgi:hypothetical protein